MARRNHIPQYRLHKSSGQAIVTLTDALSGARKDKLLGPFDTPASRTEYARVVGEWEARGRRLEDACPSDFTVAELVDRFLQHAETYYGKGSKEYDHFEKTTVPLIATYPHKLARDFGPAELKVVRQRMIDHHDWSRQVINRRVNRIRQIWKWGVEDGLVPAGTWHGLLVVKGLLSGKTTARETAERTEVPEDLVNETLPFLPRQVRGLVRFQLLTGARPDEACRLRLSEVDTTGEVWLYRPKEHKNAWRGHARIIGIGPDCRKLLAEFATGIGPDDFVFSPKRQREQIFAAKRAARKSCVQPSQVDRKKKRPKKVPGERYTTDSYAQAIARTCREHSLTHWHPYQLRYTAGLRVRRKSGADAAQALLGHRSVDMTDHYTRLKAEDVAAVVAKCG